MNSHNGSPLRIAIYVLEPSLASGITTLVGAVLIIGGHIVLISLHTGTIWPAYLDGYFATYYTNYIVQPILSFFSLSAVGVAESIVLWSILGGCLYALGEYIFHTIRNWHQVETNVQVLDNRVVRHPQQWSFIYHIAWRLVIGIGIALFVFLTLPLARYAFYLDHRVAAGLSAKNVIDSLGAAFGIWLILIHVSIVFIRLYTFRTRILGSMDNII